MPQSLLAGEAKHPTTEMLMELNNAMWRILVAVLDPELQSNDLVPSMLKAIAMQGLNILSLPVPKVSDASACFHVHESVCPWLILASIV